MLAVTAFHKPMKTRLVKLGVKLCPQKSSFKYELPNSARRYFERRMEESAGLIGLIGGWNTGYPGYADAWKSPTCRAGEIFSADTSSMKRERMEEYAPAAFRLAEKAVRAGYPSVASMYVSAFGWAFKGETAEKTKAMADTISKSGGSWFRPYESEAGEWKLVVEAFDKCLPTAGRVADGKPEVRAKSGRIVWAARLAPIDKAAWNWDEDRPVAESDFFLISLKAGGTGLNLTAANYVILLDPWWNPAVENQAADRAHRIGQKNPVTVYRLIAADTVEERVLELHKEKKALAEDVLGDAGSATLTPDQLMGLFR